MIWTIRLGKKEKRINNDNNLKINGRRIEFIGPEETENKIHSAHRIQYAIISGGEGIWGFASTVEKSVQSVFIVLPVRFVFCFPARSDRFHLIVDKYRPGTREGREREGRGGERGSSEESRTWSTANCSPIRFHGYIRGEERKRFAWQAELPFHVRKIDYQSFFSSTACFKPVSPTDRLASRSVA